MQMTGSIHHCEGQWGIWR